MVLLSRANRNQTVGRGDVECGGSATRGKGENESRGCGKSSPLRRKVVGVDEEIHGRCIGAVAWKGEILHQTERSRAGLWDETKG